MLFLSYVERVKRKKNLKKKTQKKKIKKNRRTKKTNADWPIAPNPNTISV